MRGISAISPEDKNRKDFFGVRATWRRFGYGPHTPSVFEYNQLELLLWWGPQIANGSWKAVGHHNVSLAYPKLCRATALKMALGSHLHQKN